MTMTRIKRSLSLILCMVLIAAMALFTTGCSDNNQTNETTIEAPQTSAADAEITEAQTAEAQTNQENVSDDVTVLGQGETVFTFTVTDKDGNETAFEIHTDKTIVGEALLELELIAGDMGDYGLYVKTVNGITADYDVDGTYWAFYIDGEYAMTGVDATEIVVGSTYAFKVEK